LSNFRSPFETVSSIAPVLNSKYETAQDLFDNRSLSIAAVGLANNGKV
jgi:hypothetical protein